MQTPRPMADYPHTQSIGSLVFLAGQGCRDPKTNECCGIERDLAGNIVRYDICEQTRGVLANIERVLHAEDLTTNDLVDVNVFLKDMKDFEAMNKVWNEYFADKKSPTRTTVAVSDLPSDNFVEMKAIAARRINK